MQFILYHVLSSYKISLKSEDICQTKHTLHEHLEEHLHALVCIHARLWMQRSDTLDPGYREVRILQYSTTSHCNVDDLIRILNFH